MTDEELDAIRCLGHNVRQILRNRLTYPKVIVSLAKDRFLTENEILKMKQCVDECVLLTEAEIASVLWKLEQPGEENRLRKVP